MAQAAARCGALDGEEGCGWRIDTLGGVSATRLLVLGVVRGYGRAHGYLVGTDLISWGADGWANVKWGSIYHALRTMADAGLLRDYGDVPGRTEYELTERGEAEYLRLLREAVRRPQSRPDQLGAALAMLPSLPRDEAVRLLRERLTALEETRDKAQTELDARADAPLLGSLAHWGCSNLSKAQCPSAGGFV